ncbi:MAG: thermonuclease family protein [Candidatus Binatia bacterium]
MLLIAVGAAVAFAIGRWSSAPPTKPVRDIPETISGTPLVLDGDTLDFDGLRVRLFGIDAFERDQLCTRGDGGRYACGQVARESLVVAIARAPVSCTRRDIDKYGRMVAVCRTRDGDLGAKVVSDGVALAYRHYSTEYVDEEDAARLARRGVWAGQFEPPWDYRRGNQPKAAR